MGWIRFGPFLIDELECGSSCLSDVQADAALFVPGWEDRAVAFLQKGRISARSHAILKFEPPPDARAAVEEQIKSISLQYPGVSILDFDKSTFVEQNAHKIRGVLRQLSEQGANSIFIDISVLPRVYIQSMLGWIFIDGLFSNVVMGYAEGLYDHPVNEDGVEQSGVKFSAARPLTGMAGPCREKRLVTVLGGERANCYALIERMAPDYIHVFATRSGRHVEFDKVLNVQIEKIKVEYSGKVIQQADVDAFSVKSFLSACDLNLFREKKDVATTIYAGGTKPHAVATAIVAAACRNTVEARVRLISEYVPKQVRWSGRYHIFRVVDLRSWKLPGLSVWAQSNQAQG